jgi:UDP-N-acetylmuramoylalanine-D-glutamate ligase
MNATTTQPVVGLIGLGDPGLPMATAIAEAGYSLHVWARRPASFAAPGDAAYVRDDALSDLAAFWRHRWPARRHFWATRTRASDFWR